jgi:hypothetical protein
MYGPAKVTKDQKRLNIRLVEECIRWGRKNTPSDPTLSGISIDPLSAGHNLAMTRNNEDLPQPEGPEMRQPWPLVIFEGHNSDMKHN